MTQLGKKSLGSIRNGDRETVNSFIAYLEQNYSVSIADAIFPDSTNRSSKDIDAVVDRFAIEHTSIDSIVGQRENNALFQLVFVPVQDEFSPFVDAHYWIPVPFGSVGQIKKLREARGVVKNWFSNTATALELGYHPGLVIPNLNITVSVTKSRDLDSKVIFLRSAEPDRNLSSTLKNIIQRKSIKLKDYKEKGLSTLLVIESEDIAFMSEHKFKSTYREAFGLSLPPHIDAIFFADSSNHMQSASFSLIAGSTG